MPEEFINKYVSVTPETWDRLKRYSESPNVRRAPGIQAGIILKEFLDSKDQEKEGGE